MTETPTVTTRGFALAKSSSSRKVWYGLSARTAMKVLKAP